MKKGRFETNSKSNLPQKIALIALAVVVAAGIACFLLSLGAMGKVADAVENGDYAQALTLYRDSNAVYRRLGRGKVRSALEDSVPMLSEDALKRNAKDGFALACATALDEEAEAMQQLAGTAAYCETCEAIAAGDFTAAENAYANMNDFGYERYYDEIVERFYAAIRETPYPAASDALVDSEALRAYETMEIFAHTLQIPSGNNRYVRYVELICSLGDYELFNEVCRAFQVTMPDVQKTLSSAKNELKKDRANTAVLKARLGELDTAIEALQGFDENAYLVSDYLYALTAARNALEKVLDNPVQQETAFSELTAANDSFLDVLELIGKAIGDVSEIRTNLPDLA